MGEEKSLEKKALPLKDFGKECIQMSFKKTKYVLFAKCKYTQSPGRRYKGTTRCKTRVKENYNDSRIRNKTESCLIIRGATTSISLKKCIGNINGKLKGGKKNFQRSVKNCYLTNIDKTAVWNNVPQVGGIFLTCMAKDKKGIWKTSSIDLNKFIGQVDGGLKC